MTPAPTPPSFFRNDEMIPYAQLHSMIQDFEALLRDHDITIAQGSPLEQIGLEVLSLADIKKATQANPNADIRAFFSGVLGLYDLMRKILLLRDNTSFPQLVPHFRLLSTAQPSAVSKTVSGDQESNKLFELHLALCAMQIGTDLALDDPLHSSHGTNPDVIVTIQQQTLEGILRPRRWAFACKTLHARKSTAFRAALQSGLGQIERAPVDIGAIVIDVRNLIHVADIWPATKDGSTGECVPDVFPSKDEPIGILHRHIDTLSKELFAGIAKEELWSFFNSEKIARSVLLYFHAATGVLTEHGPTPTLLRTLNRIPIGTAMCRDLVVFEELQNAACPLPIAATP
jgi:hypothetical protein